MKSLWIWALLVSGLSFYDPEFILVFSAIILIDLIIGSRKNSIKMLRGLKNKQQLLLLKRINTGIEKEINNCYLTSGKHSKGKSS